MSQKALYDIIYCVKRYTRIIFRCHGETMVWKGGILAWCSRPKLWRGVVKWYNSRRQFQICSPNIWGCYCAPYEQNNPPNGSCAQDAAGIAVIDQCRHLLICFAMRSWWAPAASFAWFCNMYDWQPSEAGIIFSFYFINLILIFTFHCFDWCCFYYFLRNSLVALLEALFARCIVCIYIYIY